MLLAICGSAGVQQALSQERQIVGDTRGKDFWVCFPQNALLEQNKTIAEKLFITSDRATKGYVSIPGLREKIDFALKPSEILPILIDSIVQILTSERVLPLGVHIVADNDVAVFGLSHRQASTDAFLAYPTSVLGTTYRAVGYYPDNGFASQIAVVATQDHTLMNMTLTADTKGGHKAGETIAIELNQGDVYMVQGNAEAGRKSDLTGSLVTTTKPVGFMIGHGCAQVPPDVMYCNQLLEMEPPIPSWGRQFYVGRYESKGEYAMRVVASEDNTQVFVNNKLVAKLNAGGFFENNHNTDNSLVTSSRPVLVVEYAQSSEADSVPVGDPFMMLITPTEQFLNYYRFATPISGEWHHYVNLVVPVDAIPSLRIDGRPVPARLFKTIGISKYGVAQYEVGYNSHSASCDKPFGLYVYGFGVGVDNFDSYGNDGGQLVETVPIVADTARPELDLVSTDGNLSLALIARDDRLFDAGLASITVIDSQNFQSPIFIPRFDVGTPEVPLRFKLYDSSSCGFMSLKLTDAANNVSYWVICRTLDSGRWIYKMTEGRDNICPSCKSWTVQVISTPSFTMSDVTFQAPNYLGNVGTFDHFSTRLSGGFQGLFIYPFDKGVQLAGGIGYASFSGAAISRHSTFVSDSILYGDTSGSSKYKLIQDITAEAAVQYLTVNGGVYYYAIPEKLYFYGGIAAGFLINSSYTESSQIVYPATLVDSTGRSAGARSIDIAQGSLPKPTKLLIALELSPGVQFKLSQSISLLAGAYMNLPIFDAVQDLNWHLTTFGARIGLQYRR